MTRRIRRWLGAVALAGVVVATGLSASGCGSGDNGGVIQGPTTTKASSGKPDY